MSSHLWVLRRECVHEGIYSLNFWPCFKLIFPDLQYRLPDVRFHLDDHHLTSADLDPLHLCFDSRPHFRFRLNLAKILVRKS